MTHDMMRPDGSAPHSHTYTNFGATSVDRSAGTLILEGTVLGSGPIGETPIIIRLNTVTGRFSFELPSNGHLQGELQGVIRSFSPPLPNPLVLWQRQNYRSEKGEGGYQDMEIVFPS